MMGITSRHREGRKNPACRQSLLLGVSTTLYPTMLQGLRMLVHSRALTLPPRGNRVSNQPKHVVFGLERKQEQLKPHKHAEAR